MAKNQESLNRSLFDLLRSKGYHPTMLDTSGKEIPIPEEAEVFQFKFEKDGVEYGTVTVSIDGLHKLVIYFGDEVANSEKEHSHGNDDVSWYQLLNQLKHFSKNHQLSFEIKNVDNLKYDMAKRDHMKKKEENLSEGYYPMGKKASYSDNIPTVKMIIQHTRQIEEGEQRYRNIARIFVENMNGERFLVPTTKPGLARVYARHIAEGGTPYDERGQHINSLVEEYSKMAGFVRATRNGQFNESAQKLVNEGINHYQKLRETLSKMTGHRGYNAYFESYTPALMETEGEESNLNELFVQETLDPRIESVMPILSRLHKQISEMSEVSELAEWADSLTEAPGAETLAHNEKTEKENLDSFDLDEATDLKSIPEIEVTEMDDAEKAHLKIQTPAAQRKQSGKPDWKVSTQDLEKEKERSISGPEGLRALTKRLQDIGRLEEEPNEGLLQLDDMDEGLAGAALGGVAGAALTKSPQGAMTGAQVGSAIQDKMSDQEEVEESGLQAYLGNKKYGKEGMDALRKAGREHASKEKMAKIRAKYDKLDEEDMAEAGVKQLPTQGADYSKYDTDHLKMLLRPGILHRNEARFKALIRKELQKREQQSQQGVAEDLDANQKRVGQLGPTEPVGKNEKNLRGKLVGANENFINQVDQAVVAEMDKSQPSSDRGGESSGDPHAKGSKATPIKADKAKKDFAKILQKNVDKANKAKQDTDKKVSHHQVKEGQEDLEAILRLIKK